MLQNELEDLLGRKMSTEEFGKANLVYMTMNSINKENFARIYQDSAIYDDIDCLVNKIKMLEKEITELKEQRSSDGIMCSDIYHKWHKDSSIRDAAIRLMGKQFYLRHAITAEYELTEEDRLDLFNALS